MFDDNEKESDILDSYSDRLLRRALIVHKKLASTRPDIFNPFIALTLLNLGNIAEKRKKTDQAAQYYLQALAIHKQMAAKNPATYLPNLANNYNKLSLFYKKTDKLERASMYAGHNQLLQGQYDNAKKTYQQIKGYKQMLLDDFKAFEADGLILKDMRDMKIEIEKW